jgi:hypothetical protein
LTHSGVQFLGVVPTVTATTFMGLADMTMIDEHVSTAVGASADAIGYITYMSELVLIRCPHGLSSCAAPSCNLGKGVYSRGTCGTVRPD